MFADIVRCLLGENTDLGVASPLSSVCLECRCYGSLDVQLCQGKWLFLGQAEWLAIFFFHFLHWALWKVVEKGPFPWSQGVRWDEREVEQF